MAIQSPLPSPSPFLRHTPPNTHTPPGQDGSGAGVGGSGAVDGPVVPPLAPPLTLPPLLPPGLGQGQQGASAVDGPVLPPVSSMGNLSAADMLQIIRKEIKNIAEALQKAQAQVIQSNQSTIQAKSKATVEKLNEAIEKLEEAQKIKDAMGIFNKVMYGVMGVVLALLTPLLAVSSLAVVAWGAYAASITVNEKDNGKIMEDCMTKISEAFGKAWESEGKDKQRENGMIAFTSFMASIQILVSIIAIVASFGSSTPAVAGSAATSAAAQAALAATQSATAAAATAGSVAGSTAATAASTATTTASTAASAAGATAQTVAQVAQKLLGIVQASVTIGTSAAKITAGVYDYQATMTKADTEELRAQIKMLQNLLKNELDFLQQLVSLQAELDKGVASILRDEHQTNQHMQQVTQFS